MYRYDAEKTKKEISEIMNHIFDRIRYCAQNAIKKDDYGLGMIGTRFHGESVIERVGSEYRTKCYLSGFGRQLSIPTSTIDEARTIMLAKSEVKNICKSVGARGALEKEIRHLYIEMVVPDTAISRYFCAKELEKKQREQAHQEWIQGEINKIRPLVERLKCSPFTADMSDAIRAADMISENIKKALTHEERKSDLSIHVNNVGLQWGAYSSDIRGPEYRADFETYGYRKLGNKDEVLAFTCAFCEHLISKITPSQNISHQIEYEYWPDENSFVAAKAMFSIHFSGPAAPEIILRDILM